MPYLLFLKLTVEFGSSDSPQNSPALRPWAPSGLGLAQPHPPPHCTPSYTELARRKYLVNE